MAYPRLEHVASLDEDQATAVLALARELAAADGSNPLSEQSILDVKHGRPGIQHLLLVVNGDIAGYAHLDPHGVTPTVELVALEPSHLAALAEHVVGHGSGVQIWAHGKDSRIRPVLEEAGLRTERVLLQLRRSLDADWAEPVWPPGVTVRTFVVGQDEAAWLAVNNASFEGHPEQAGWEVGDIEGREAEEWFDPAGFFLAERDGELVGFHWTKVHQFAPPDGKPIGEVYVVGVSPTMQGQRLGSALTAVGLIHLRDRGLPSVMLYVDESNTSAVHVYERLGFAAWDRDVCFVNG